MQISKHIILFVHGFGVMKDARGMFTDIRNSLPEDCEGVLIDLNTKDDGDNIYVNPFSKQVEILKNVRASYPDQKVDIICHSQGCIVAALADLPNVRKTLFLAPALNNGYAKVIEYFSKNPNTKIDVAGISRLARRDGTFTTVPSEFWKEKEALDIDAVYQKYITSNLTYAVKALSDEVVSNADFDKVFDGATILALEGNHDFTDNARQELIKACVELVKR